MLGFSPISSQPISGGPFSLIAVPQQMSASGGITFGGTGHWGLIFRPSARGGITFSGSANRIVKYFRTASGLAIAFSGTGHLTLAGKPIRFVAAGQNYDFKAQRSNYRFQAQRISYTFRGGR